MVGPSTHTHKMLSWQISSFYNIRRNYIILMVIIILLSSNVNAFYALTPPSLGKSNKYNYKNPFRYPRYIHQSYPIHRTIYSNLKSDTTSYYRKIQEEVIVDELLKNVQNKESSDIIQDLMSSLSESSTTASELNETELFQPVIGYYNVTYTVTERKNDNPVGGKWTRLQGRLWNVKRTMQHVLPPPSSETDSLAVAEVINAIRLECLWGFLCIWILLRGDAIPLYKEESKPDKLKPNLSNRTVKVYFDKPRIGISLENKMKFSFRAILSLGPTSSVVLDTPYVDERIRLGRGGISGSQFIFSRVDDMEAKEDWKWVISNNNNLTKKKLMIRFGALSIVSGLLFNLLQHRFWCKLVTGISTLFSSISFLWLLFSTGGIETRGDTFVKGR